MTSHGVSIKAMYSARNDHGESEKERQAKQHPSLPSPAESFQDEPNSLSACEVGEVGRARAKGLIKMCHVSHLFESCES